MDARVLENLGSPVALALPSADTYGAAEDVAFSSSGGVYITGEVSLNSSSSNSATSGVYWKNGALVTLPQPSGDSLAQAYGIALDTSGDLYIAGLAGSAWTATVPAYWKYSQ